ncbi:hypothetical protein GCM10022224_040570 [Nonomuraea antimicrobica]|uniref:Uncharacterized protein n=1 Tax=Nonomuraea antimicrobica TaxID=561173 RepID=A0ABP7BYX1_9ACTN
MTITITLAHLSLPDGLAEAVRRLLPLTESVILAIAGACGAGLLAQLGLQFALALARRVLEAE